MRRLCSCGRLVDKGSTCPCQTARKHERQRAQDAKRPSSSARGYDREWRDLRNRFIKAYPACAMCGKPAKHVDHIIEIRKAPQRRLDPSNLRSLCHSCHSRHTARDHWGNGNR